MVRPTGAEAQKPGSHALAWLVALVLAARAAAIALPIAALFVVVSALAAGSIEDERWRLAVGALVSVGLPGLLYLRLAAFARARSRLRPPGVGAFVAIVDVIAVGALAFGFADDVGRALRRHGDWFVGERNGLAARGYRRGLTLASRALERFDPAPELAPIVIPPDPHRIPDGPWRPGETPPEAEPTTLAWFHPLAGPRRALPISEARRFGAARPPPRPVECELGHCGVDLGSTLGEPVFAVFAGVVERIERDETRGGRAGRYVRIGHKDSQVVTRYIHLDSIRDDLKEGDRVDGGQLIGRLGQSGTVRSAPHLHFGLSLRVAGGGERYLDPEPYLRVWRLPDQRNVTVASLTNSPASAAVRR
jgi:hypothetical protein